MWEQKLEFVTAEQREWLEHSFAWFMDQFGPSRLQQATVVLPTPEAFPVVYDKSLAAVEQLVGQVCDYMLVPRQRIQVTLFEEPQAELGPGLPLFEGSVNRAAGLFVGGRYSRRVELSFETHNLDNPESLIAVAAHELGHVLLIGDGRLSGDEEESEPLTDLLTVYLGLGVFTANAAFQFRQFQGGGRQGWSGNRLGYLSEGEFAYALALFAWLRGETRPQWATFLAMNVGAYFRKCLKYLEEQQSPYRISLRGRLDSPANVVQFPRPR